MPQKQVLHQYRQEQAKLRATWLLRVPGALWVPVKLRVPVPLLSGQVPLLSGQTPLLSGQVPLLRTPAMCRSGCRTLRRG